MHREHLSSRLGFILLSAGCAIGIGNVWKFPYITGQNGGAIFVLIYLLFLLILGIPVMTIEFAMGRAAQKSPVHMYQPLEPVGSKWHIHGVVCLAGNYTLMMFYTCVSGWMLQYFVDTARGLFEGLDTAAVAQSFFAMLGNPGTMVLYTVGIIIAGFSICSIGLQKGLERVTKYMMVALLGLMIVLAVHSCFLPGGKEGLLFYLMPSVERMQSVGVVRVIVSAMNQAFFTLSLGIGAMAIFGSYLNRERSLMGEAVNVAVLDTFVAFCSGLIIFPACSAFGVAADSGPNLIFITLPNIFNHLPSGRLWGSLFFLFMTFASFSTVLAVFEVLIASTVDLTGWSRKKACLANCLLMLVLAMPCVLGFNLLSGFHPFGGDSSFMDLEDFLVSNLLLPIGAITFILFCSRRYGWGWKNFLSEANSGKGLKVHNGMRIYFSYILPVIILIVFIFGLYDFFQ